MCMYSLKYTRGVGWFGGVGEDRYRRNCQVPFCTEWRKRTKLYSFSLVLSLLFPHTISAFLPNRSNEASWIWLGIVGEKEKR